MATASWADIAMAPEPQWLTGYLEKNDEENFSMSAKELSKLLFVTLGIPKGKVKCFDNSGVKKIVKLSIKSNQIKSNLDLIEIDTKLKFPPPPQTFEKL